MEISSRRHTSRMDLQWMLGAPGIQYCRARHMKCRQCLEALDGPALAHAAAVATTDDETMCRFDLWSRGAGIDRPSKYS